MTNTDVCNLALSFLKRRKIVSIEQECEEARACKLHYDHLRRMVLRAYNWGFAKAIVPLARLDVKSPVWRYVYAYPDKCVAARFVFSKDCGSRSDFMDKFDVFLVDGDVLALGCDVDMAFLEYTYDVTDARLFSDSFVDALSHLLASDLAIGLCGSANLQNIHYQLYEVATQRAKSTDANEKFLENVYSDSYVKARG